MGQYNTLHVLRDLHLEAPVELANGAVLLPMKGISCTDKLEIADQLMEIKRDLGWSKGELISPEERDAQKEKILDECREAVKLSVLGIPGIEANSREDALEITDPYVRDVSQILSLIRNISITIPFWEVDDVADPKLKEAVFSFQVARTDISNQSGEGRQQLLENVLQGVPFRELLNRQPTLRMALRWYLEAYRDKDPDMKFLKFWIALEALAEQEVEDRGLSFDKAQLGPIREKLLVLGTEAGWDQPTLENRVNGALSQLNRMSIKEKIRALMRHERIESRMITESMDVIDVLYEARNLIAHHGGLETLPQPILESIKDLEKRLGGLAPPDLPILIRNILLPILGSRLRIEIVPE